MFVCLNCKKMKENKRELYFMFRSLADFILFSFIFGDCSGIFIN